MAYALCVCVCCCYRICVCLLYLMCVCLLCVCVLLLPYVCVFVVAIPSQIHGCVCEHARSVCLHVSSVCLSVCLLIQAHAAAICSSCGRGLFLVASNANLEEEDRRELQARARSTMLEQYERLEFGRLMSSPPQTPLIRCTLLIL